VEKTSKQVFVVMPFGDTPTRGKLELDEFYNQTLKASIESFQGFSNRYIVNRSSDEFDIGRQIVRSIYAADLGKLWTTSAQGGCLTSFGS
jgi:hypothetical protein